MRCWPGVRPRLLATVPLLALALTACARPPQHLSIVGVETLPFRAPELVLRVALPDALREGLERGVPLSFRLDLDSGGERSARRRELRYLPLSRQYQLREPATGYSRGFASSAAALSALERWPLPGIAADRPAFLRVSLETARLPAPLVLPALFDRQWRLDSGIAQWPPAPR